jgi:hypothetical protein
MNSIRDKGVIQLVKRADVPRGHPILPNKFVLKIKTDSNGKATEYKARLTPTAVPPRLSANPSALRRE